MLYMTMHKMTDALERGEPPTPNVIQEMGKLIGEAQQKGILHSGAGLKPTSTRVRMRCVNGRCTTAPTPRRGAQELIRGFVQLKTRDLPDAISHAERIAQILGDVELDIGPVTEPWDLGVMPRPANPPLQVLLTLKSDAASEAGADLPQATLEKLRQHFDQLAKEGVFQGFERLKPSARGARLVHAGGKKTWTDGPFAETKELISGFAILRLGSLAEARAFTERYADILGDIEVDVREVVEG